MKSLMKRICILFACFLFLQLFVPYICAAEDNDPVNDLMKNVEFTFSVVDYKYTFTVSNHTDYDIVRFKVYDYQRNGETEKGGASDFRWYPVNVSAECAVPSGETVSFAPIKVMWNDCDNIVTYVYYVEFSDGSKWGTEYPITSMIPDFALRYDVPFAFSVAENTTLNQHDAEKGKYYTIAKIIIGFFLISGIVAVIIILTTEKNKTANRSPAGVPTKKTNTEKGQIGEFIAYDKLDRIPGEKRLLRNLYVPKADGTETEIDCLLIHQNGLFVIESKNCCGSICGSRNDHYWTIVFNNYRHGKLYNPIMQNQGHIRNLKTYLSYQSQDRYRKMPEYSIIAFSPSADISKVQTDGLSDANIYVINYEQIVPTINDILKKGIHLCFTEEEVTDIYRILLPLTFKTEEEKQNHIRNISQQNRD